MVVSTFITRTTKENAGLLTCGSFLQLTSLTVREDKQIVEGGNWDLEHSRIKSQDVLMFIFTIHYLLVYVRIYTAHSLWKPSGKPRGMEEDNIKKTL